MSKVHDIYLRLCRFAILSVQRNVNAFSPGREQIYSVSYSTTEMKTLTASVGN